MKYDVKEYIDTAGTDDPDMLYAITGDGEPTGLTLPTICKSVEMGREFLAWHDKEFRNIRYVSASHLTNMFVYFLESRMRKAKEQPPEPEESTEASEYKIYSYQPQNTNFARCRYRIEHVKSSNFVSLTFGSREDAEGYCEWYVDGWAADMHETKLSMHEKEFARYKAETTEPEYACPYCGKNTVKKENDEDALYLRCHQCGAQSPTYYKPSQPDESWIRKELE